MARVFHPPPLWTWVVHNKMEKHSNFLRFIFFFSLGHKRELSLPYNHPTNFRERVGRRPKILLRTTHTTDRDAAGWRRENIRERRGGESEGEKRLLSSLPTPGEERGSVCLCTGTSSTLRNGRPTHTHTHSTEREGKRY